MQLPQVLEFGPHRLKLLTVSRNADDVLDARRCSDHALTAFCFVGEIQDSTSSNDPPLISWYYSPLYQFERKKIRVDESVIVAALTKGIAEHCSSETKAEPSSRLMFVDAASVAFASDAPSLDDSKEKAPAKERTGRSSLPTLFIRLGKSTTFREYKPILSEPAEVTAAKTVDAETASHTKADKSQITQPVLSPLLPCKPSLKPLSSRFGFSVRRPPLRRDGFNNFMTANTTGNAPNLVDDLPTTPSRTGSVLHSSRSPHTVTNTNMGSRDTAVTNGSNNNSNYDDENERSVMSTATAPVVLESLSAPLNATHMLHSLSTPLCTTPDPCARKGTLSGGVAGSSLSSAFLSTSNFPSGLVSQLPTSVTSTGNLIEVESDVGPVPNHGAAGGSVRCGDVIPFFVKEPLLVSLSATSMPEPQSPSRPPPPPPQQQQQPRLRTPRRPSLRAQLTRVQSEHGGSSSCSSRRESQREVDQVRAATPPAMYVR